MLSVKQPKVQGVAGAVLLAPKPFSFLKKKSATGAGGARRALAALGSNNAQFNMNMAKSHLAMAQEGFTNRWNFNPLKEVPLAPGRYQWAPLVMSNDIKITPTPSGVVTKDMTKPSINSNPASVTLRDTDIHKSIQDAQDNRCTVSVSTNDQENIENEVKTEKECKQQVLSPSTETNAVPLKSVSSNSQICITDFFRPQKRKSSYLLGECQTCPNTPPKKKTRSVH